MSNKVMQKVFNLSFHATVIAGFCLLVCEPKFFYTIRAILIISASVGVSMVVLVGINVYREMKEKEHDSNLYS